MSKKIKIQAIKFEIVDGKKTGKSFAFEMDPKEMAKYKTEATVRKNIADYVAKSGVFKPAELDQLKYSMGDFLVEWKKMVPVVKAEELAALDKSENNPDSRVTPHHINRLVAGEIFVFGSNALGHHDGVAAKIAHEKFGAVYELNGINLFDYLQDVIDSTVEWLPNTPLDKYRDLLPDRWKKQ